MKNRFGRVVIAVAVGAVGLTPAAESAPAGRGIPRTRVFSTVASPGWIVTPLEASHVAWSWRGSGDPRLQMRVATDAGISGWTDVVEAHDLEAATRHFSGVVSVPGAVAVRWRSLAADPLDDVVVDFLDTRQGPAVAPDADDDGGDPAIVTRAQWGADESIKETTGSCERRFFPVQQLFVHHTAGANFDHDPAATMRAILWYHTVRRGWCDIGYNFVVSWDGRIFEGRWARAYRPWETHTSEDVQGRAVAGAHVGGYNSGSVGVAAMGNFSTVVPPPELRRALAELLAWEVDRHDLDPLGSHRYVNPETGASRRLPYIAGHRDAGRTDCPGDNLYAALDDIRRDTAAAAAQGKISTAITFDASSRRVVYGESVTLSGTLVDRGGTVMPLRPVRTYVRDGEAPWGDGPASATGSDGAFAFSFTPAANLRAAAVFEGDETYWGAQSPTVVVKVRPVVTLSLEGASSGEDGLHHVPAGAPAILAGEISPVHPRAAVIVRIQRIEPDGTPTPLVKKALRAGTDSRYRFEFRPPDPPGTRYRAVSWFRADGDHAASPSPEVIFSFDA